MKRVKIHHVLNGKTVVTSIQATEREATDALRSLGRIYADNGVIAGPNFAIPARSVEMMEVEDV